MSKDGIKIGFDFTPFPDVIWDDNIDLSLGEFRLLGYLLKQGKFGQSIEPVSDEDLIKGKFDTDTNKRDKGCGLTSRNGVKQARELLLVRKWIDAVNVSDDPSRPKWLYKVRLSGQQSGVTARQLVSQRDSTVSSCDSTVSQRDTKDIRSIDTRDTRDNTSSFFDDKVSDLKDPLGLKEEIILPDWVPLEQWGAFRQMRVKIKKPMTHYAEKLLIKKLTKFHASGEDIAAVLDQSIMNNWQDVYAVKSGSNYRDQSRRETETYVDGLEQKRKADRGEL